MTRIDIAAEQGLAADVLAAGAELVDLLYEERIGRYALTLSGSISKRTSDDLSDVDFRFYSDELPDVESPAWEQTWTGLKDRWATRGLRLDELWFRTVAEVDAVVDEWLAGQGRPDDLVWTVWGYHPLTDLCHQIAVVDEHRLTERWRTRLVPYPESARDAAIARHLVALRYWRDDYHYENKAQRGDVVFLAGLTAALIHRMVQVLAALNHVYFPGDGNNLAVAARMPTRPRAFEARVEEILVPTDARDHVGQRVKVIALIDEVEELVRRAIPGKEWK